MVKKETDEEILNEVEEVPDEELEELKREAEELGIDVDKEGSELLSPSSEVKDNVYKFFRDVLKEEDSTRVGNLNDAELGKVEESVRALHNISAYSQIEELPIVADYIMAKALTVTSTSMSRKGWFLSLVVTQIKRETKTKTSATDTKNFSLFGKKKQETGE